MTDGKGGRRAVVAALCLACGPSRAAAADSAFVAVRCTEEAVSVRATAASLEALLREFGSACGVEIVEIGTPPPQAVTARVDASRIVEGLERILKQSGIASYALVFGPGGRLEKLLLLPEVGSAAAPPALIEPRDAVEPPAPERVSIRELQDLVAGPQARTKRTEVHALGERRNGLRLESVAEGGALSKAGLRPGDILLQFAGRPTEKEEDVAAAVAAWQQNPAQVLQIALVRDGTFATRYLVPQ